jgi:hypothetical protein
MYIITIEGKNDEGAFSLKNENGNQVLCIFEDQDDADRYVMQLNELGKYPKMEVYEVDDEVLIDACEMHGYEYTVITKNDIIVPPSENDYF